MIPRSQITRSQSAPHLSHPPVAPQAPPEDPGTIGIHAEKPDPSQHAVPLVVGSGPTLWVTGAPFVSSLRYTGHPEDLDLQDIQRCLEQLGSDAAQSIVPGQPTPAHFPVAGGELRVVLTLPDDSQGTPGATPMGEQAAKVTAVAHQKHAFASALLGQLLIPDLAKVSMNYLPGAIGGPDESLPVTPLAVLKKMPWTQAASLGDRIYLPLPSGEHGGVQACFLGFSADQDALIVAFEAPPPDAARFDADAMHAHPNGNALLYRHPVQAGFWRDTAQPPRTHLQTIPTLEALQALTNRTVLVAPSDDETGLPVTLLSVTPADTSPPGKQLVSLRVQSNFDPFNSPLGTWSDAWYEGDVTGYDTPADGVHEWTLQTDLNSDGRDCCCISFDPLLPPQAPPVPQADPLPPRTRESKAFDGPPAAAAFATLAPDTPVHVNGVAGHFQGVAPASEAPDAIWVTIDRDTDTSGIGSIRSVVVPGTNLLSHLVSCTQSTVTLG